MDDFLAYICKHKAELKKEIADLEAAERIYRESRVQIKSVQQRFLFLASETPPKRMTIKQMVVDILEDMWPHGMTALEILDQIHTRWNAELERTSLSPQLTRLKYDGLIVRDHGVWRFVKRDAPPEQPDETS